MPEAPAVRDTQRRVLEAILGFRSPTPFELRQLFRVPPAGSIESRWHIYADGLVARVVEALENDYPAVAKVLGEGPLRSLTARYLKRFAPRSHDLGRVGDRLAGFLEDDPLAQDLPFLPDLARLEWAVAEAFVAADVAALSWDDLARIGPEAAIEMPLSLSPRTALVTSTWPVHQIWAARDHPAASIDVPLTREPVAVRVSRRGLEVTCRRATALESQLMEAAARGERLADLLDDDGEQAAALIATLRRLVDDGVFAQPQDGPPAADGATHFGPERG